jgi:hypothetical protein
LSCSQNNKNILNVLEVLHAHQGDQIVQIFALRVIVFFGQVIEKYRIIPDTLATIFRGKIYVLMLTKNGLGYILGDFFHQLVWSP